MRYVSWLLVGSLLLGFAGPLRAEGEPPVPDSGWFGRLNELNPTQMNSLGQSAVALLASITTLWNVRAHLSNIRGGISDWWNFRANRRNFFTEQAAYDEFVRAVSRATSERPDTLFYQSPSLVQRFDGHLREWMRTVTAIDEHARSVWTSSAVPDYEAARLELASHLRFGVIQRIAGMMYDVDMAQPERLPAFRTAVEQWELTGHSAELDRWLDGELARPMSLFNREESGRRWVLEYIVLSHRLAAAEWLDPNVRSTLRLDAWLRVNDSRRWASGESVLTTEQLQWWLRLQERMGSEREAARLFMREFNGLVDQLNRRSARYGRHFAISFLYPDTRVPGQIHVDTANGAEAMLVSEMTGHFGALCGSALASAEVAREEAESRGTLRGMSRRTVTKILTPAALVATGITGAILAYNGFHGLLRQILFGP